MVTLTRVKGLKGIGARSTYEVDPPCHCGRTRVYRNFMDDREIFTCDGVHLYPLILPKGWRP